MSLKKPTKHHSCPCTLDQVLPSGREDMKESWKLITALFRWGFHGFALNMLGKSPTFPNFDRFIEADDHFFLQKMQYIGMHSPFSKLTQEPFFGQSRKNLTIGWTIQAQDGPSHHCRIWKAPGGQTSLGYDEDIGLQNYTVGLQKMLGTKYGNHDYTVGKKGTLFICLLYFHQGKTWDKKIQTVECNFMTNKNSGISWSNIKQKTHWKLIGKDWPQRNSCTIVCKRALWVYYTKIKMKQR